MLVFEEWGKPQHPDKKLSKQRREPTTNSPTHGVDAGRDLNQANIGWRGVLIPYSLTIMGCDCSEADLGFLIGRGEKGLLHAFGV